MCRESGFEICGASNVHFGFIFERVFYSGVVYDILLLAVHVQRTFVFPPAVAPRGLGCFLVSICLVKDFVVMV